MAITAFLDDDEITGEVYAVNVSRGRSLEGEAFDPGGGTIQVRNYNANFNPYFLVETSALLLESTDDLLQENGDRILLESGNGTGAGAYGEIKLGRKVVVKDGAVTVFTGYVEDFDFVYAPGGYAEASITVRDSLATLGATTLKEWTTTEAQLTGARVSALLNRSEVGFPSGASFRSIATGTQPLGSETLRFGTNALQELQRINRAEYGRLFVDRTGKLTFGDRYEVFGLTSSATFDNDTNFPFSGIEIRFGTELLHFAVTVTRAGSDTEQTAEDAALIAEYSSLGVRNRGITNMPYLADDHAYGLAQLVLQRSSSFSAVISGLTVPLGKLGTSDRATVTALDIGDVVTVSWTPTGSSGVVTQVLAIEAVTYSVNLHENAATVSFQLSDASDPDYFQVDTDAVDGPKLVAP